MENTEKTLLQRIKSLEERVSRMEDDFPLTHIWGVPISEVLKLLNGDKVKEKAEQEIG